MNKKVAAFLFALGLGASASAVAWPDWECGMGCRTSYDGCMATPGYDPGQCNMDRIDCEARCGI